LKSFVLFLNLLALASPCLLHAAEGGVTPAATCIELTRTTEIDGFDFGGNPAKDTAIMLSPQRCIAKVNSPYSAKSQTLTNLVLMGHESGSWQVLDQQSPPPGAYGGGRFEVLRTPTDVYVLFWAKYCSDCLLSNFYHVDGVKLQPLDWEPSHWPHNVVEAEADGSLSVTAERVYAGQDLQWEPVTLIYRLDGGRAVLDRDKTRRLFMDFFTSQGLAGFSLDALEAAKSAGAIPPDPLITCYRMILELDGPVAALRVARDLRQLKDLQDNQALKSALAQACALAADAAPTAP
jgi:hypothetical protein